VLLRLCEVTEKNRHANRRKSWKHHVFKRWLLATTVGIAVAFVSDYIERQISPGESPAGVSDERAAGISTTAPASTG
jgi:hypothetical protein